MFFQPKSLQQRTLFFVLIPTFLLLVTLSISGFLFVQHILLRQWGETAIAKLQRTAHLIDMELRRPKDLLLLLQTAGDDDLDPQVFTRIINRIKGLGGVVGVNVDWPTKGIIKDAVSPREIESPMGMMHGYNPERFEVSTPVYNSQLNNRTVSLISRIESSDNKVVGRVEVIISFDQLINQIINASWWKSNKAYLLDRDGNVLISTVSQRGLEDYYPLRSFGTVSALEKETLAAIRKTDSGTIFGPGSPPEEISGFYHLTDAPWTMVIMAPGEKVLQPIIRFRLWYSAALSLSILVILFFIKQMTSRLTLRIKEVSAAADNLANGEFGTPLAITNRDEVSELARSFNSMSGQLEQRLAMKKEINIAREVQQNLLPDAGFKAPGILADGLSLYCDETGGDYFDIVTFPENPQKVGLVVGDVVGHGIGAALLMTTVRALLRCRIFQPGNPDHIMNDVNSLLCRDTLRSGNFVTLFYLEIDQLHKTIRWVRAGHEPAIVYHPARHEFTEMRGDGLALGVDAAYCFEYNETQVEDEEVLILIGSDGAWDVANAAGEPFGKDRISKILAAGCHLHPDAILIKITEQIKEFRGDTPQNDDITLLVVKLNPPIISP